MLKENRMGKKRVQMIVKEANYEREEIMKEQTEFEEIMVYTGKKHIYNKGKTQLKR
jgi:hypothetical protein